MKAGPVFNIPLGDAQSIQWDRNTLEKIASLARGEAFEEVCSVSVQKILNALQIQVLETDSRDLIALFRRAVRNYNTLHPQEQADLVPLLNKHYERPPFLIPHTDITLDVHEKEVLVTTELKMKRNSDQTSIILDAEHHNVLKVFVNGTLLEQSQYKATEHEIIIYGISSTENAFDVRVISSIDPFQNKSAKGLYPCKKWLTTQCAPESARRIFPSLDRPDVLSTYTTTILANPKQYPYRLSNGSVVVEEMYENGRAMITWADPMPKASYLFAVVLGDFDVLEDHFKTKSGKEVALRFFVQKGKKDLATFALFTLKKAMKYDEEFCDREYDLSALKIVAMPNFNGGAMENNGLFIFNEARILCNPYSATDFDHILIAKTMMHEYFHHWRGNHVTINKWSEVALKEGLADYIAHQCLKEMFGQEVIRAFEVTMLREMQFPLDANKTAHPLLMDALSSTDEIYDATTYKKGKEFFHMLQTLLDSKREDGFRCAQNIFLDRYDGQAVTFEELLNTFEEVSGVNLTQFRQWLYQVGTPTVFAKLEYDPASQIATVYFTQTCPHPKTKEEQNPFQIPLKVELLDNNGVVIYPQKLIVLNDFTQAIVFKEVKSQPIPVFNHNLSAPIKMRYSYDINELETILLCEEDPYARKEAGDIFLERTLQQAYDKAKLSDSITFAHDLIPFYRRALSSTQMSVYAKAVLLHRLPTIRAIVREDEVYDFIAAKKVLETCRKEMAIELEPQLLQLLEEFPEPIPCTPTDPHFINQYVIRMLRNSCMAFLSLVPGNKYNDRIFETYARATNFNDQDRLLSVIVKMDDSRKHDTLQRFYDQWKDDPTILRHWITIQTTSSNCTVETLEKIFHAQGFLQDNPSHMRMFIGSFAHHLVAYHSNPGQNYPYVFGHILKFSEKNPYVAFRMAKEASKDYDKLMPEPKALMREQILRLAEPDVNGKLRSLADKLLQNS